MNRTDRLYAIVERLRADPGRPHAARRLAEHFEVSVRTIERDILALQEAGVPIYAETGRSGGYLLDVERTLPPVNFSPAEATAVAIALNTTGSTPLAQAGRSALTKIMAAMSDDDSRGAPGTGRPSGASRGFHRVRPGTAPHRAGDRGAARRENLVRRSTR